MISACGRGYAHELVSKIVARVDSSGITKDTQLYTSLIKVWQMGVMCAKKELDIWIATGIRVLQTMVASFVDCE